MHFLPLPAGGARLNVLNYYFGENGSRVFPLAWNDSYLYSYLLFLRAPSYSPVPLELDSLFFLSLLLSLPSVPTFAGFITSPVSSAWCSQQNHQSHQRSPCSGGAWTSSCYFPLGIYFDTHMLTCAELLKVKLARLKKPSFTGLLTWKGFCDTAVINILQQMLAVIFPSFFFIAHAAYLFIY